MEGFVIGNEAERQFYLAAAGIRMWYARESLPGAAPSPDFDFGVDDEPQFQPASEVPQIGRKSEPLSGDQGRQRIAQLQSLMGNKPESGQKADNAGQKAADPVKAPPATEPRSETPETVPEASLPASEPVEVQQPEPVPRVCLTAWKGSRVMLLCHIAEDASFALQENLARNILRSIGETGVSQCSVVRWPLFNNLKVTLNSESDLVSVIASAFAGDAPTETLITLGLGDETQARLIERGLGRVPEIAFSGTLASLASDPSQKRLLWQSIRVLVPGR